MGISVIVSNNNFVEFDPMAFVNDYHLSPTPLVFVEQKLKPGQRAINPNIRNYCSLTHVYAAANIIIIKMRDIYYDKKVIHRYTLSLL